VPPKFWDLSVVHGGASGGYLVEMLMAWLPQPCLLFEKAQLQVVVRQLVLDSSTDKALAIVSKAGHLKKHNKPTAVF